MILAGQQPNYLPWIGFFHKVSAADVFVLVDHVQYEKRGVTNANAVKTASGKGELTVPVLSTGRFDQTIREVEINDAVPWRRKHWRTLSIAYGKTPHFAAHAPFFEDLYARPWTHLAALNEAIIRYLLGAFRIDRPMHRSSEWPVTGAKTDLLVSLCRCAGATGYLSGAGARKYVDESVLAAAGLTHGFQEFHHPVYPQPYGAFVPNLSAVDLLFNMGPEAGGLIAANRAPSAQPGA